MGSDNFPKRVAMLFVAVAVVYFCAFNAIEHLRVRKAPWEVRFTTNETGVAAIIVTQTNLNIRQYTLLFPGETVPAPQELKHIAFDHPQQWPFDLPFGQCIFQDLTFLPGTVTMDLYDHEVELLPRTMIINKREYPWSPEATVTLYPTNRLPLNLRHPQKK